METRRGGRGHGDQVKGTQDDLPIGLQTQLETLTSISTSHVGVLWWGVEGWGGILLKQNSTLHLNSHPWGPAPTCKWVQVWGAG